MSERILYKSTPKAYLSTLPRFAYEGRIVTIISEQEACRAVEALQHYRLLGIDTETRPAFRKGVSHQVALLQVACEDVCFLFRLNRFGLPPCLCRLLEDEHVTKVGLSLKDDFMMLRKRAQFTPKAYVELQEQVKAMGIDDMSLQKIYANLLGKRISKSAQLSNWENDELTPSQQTYAATDAYACLALYHELERLHDTGFLVQDYPTEPTQTAPMPT